MNDGIAVSHTSIQHVNTDATPRESEESQKYLFENGCVLIYFGSNGGTLYGFLQEILCWKRIAGGDGGGGMRQELAKQI